MGAFLKAIAYHLPEARRSNKEISATFPDWSEEKILSKLGIGERRIAAKDEYASDLGIRACEKLFEEGSFEKTDIDFLLYCTQSPDYFLPTTACIIQDKLGLNKSIGALDFNLGCSGYVYGLSLAKGLIASGAARNVLLVTAETYSKFINPKDKSNITIFGDAATASLISSADGMWEINDFIFGTDGSGAENLIVKNGAIRHPELNGVDTISEDGEWKNNNNNLFMNGNAIFQFTVSSIPDLIKKTLEKNNLQIEAIDWFVFHQANKYMLDYIRRKIGIATDKFYVCLEHCGNTVSSSIPIALREGYLRGDLKEHQAIALAGFGVGYSWAGVVLK